MCAYIYEIDFCVCLCLCMCVCVSVCLCVCENGGQCTISQMGLQTTVTASVALQIKIGSNLAQTNLTAMNANITRWLTFTFIEGEKIALKHNF